MSKAAYLSLVSCLALAACSPSGNNSGQGEADSEIFPATVSSRDFGDYELHFNALTTDQLDPAIAGEYGIIRSKSRALLNISVLRKNELALEPVHAEVEASARNLTGQLRNLDLREITEGEAIYYIAETAIVNSESLVFSVTATPESTDTPLKVEFQKQFYIED